MIRKDFVTKKTQNSFLFFVKVVRNPFMRYTKAFTRSWQESTLPKPINEKL